MKASLFLTAAITVALTATSSFAQASTSISQFVSQHCRALASGGSDLSFVLGKSGNTTPAKVQAFNQAFAGYLARKFDLNTSAPATCATEVVSSNEVAAPTPLAYKDQPSKAKNVGSQGTEGVTVVRTALTSTKGVPVVLSYKLARPAGGKWAIANISINGKPLVGGYEKKFNDLLEAQGFDALIAKINAM